MAKGRRDTETVVILSVVGVLGILVAVVATISFMRRGDISPAVERAEKAAEAIATIVDPGISLRERRQTYIEAVAWQITNTRSNPLTIYNVVFNGEWEPAIVDDSREVWLPSVEKWPKTLTIGESCLVLHQSEVGPTHHGGRVYEKQVIYIDVYTNLGNYRFRPLEGFEALKD